VANALTSGNLAAGFVALILAHQGEFAWAAGCVGVAALCDAVDGVAARFSRSDGEFGCQLDSLADVVSFGVAPALIVYLGSLAVLPFAGIGACLAFVLCGAWRLARFQVETESRHRFVGLPIPPAGVIVTAGAILKVPAPAMLLVVTVGSLLMISRVPVPTFAEIRRLAQSDRRRRGEAPVADSEAVG
jgi:CDP-diacylglycerol--serine O-phosphatidyltransferase